MKKSVLKYSALLICMLFVQVQASAFNDPYLSKSFDISGPGKIETRTSGASVAIEGTEGNLVIVDMYVRRNGKLVDANDADVQSRLKDYQIDIDKSGNTISVSVSTQKKQNWSKDNNLSLSFDIKVPYEMSTDLNTSGGSIAISGIDGSQSIKSSGGSVKISGSSGSIFTKSSGGSLSVSEFSGILDLNTSGGSVKVDGMEGEVTINSSGGSVSLENVSGKVYASTSGGGIKADINNIEGGLTLKSSGGSISAIIPKDLPMNLDLNGGSVSTKLTNFEGEMKRDKIVGKSNGGGVLISMASSGGSIKLDYK